jgi:hypothetical protein
MKAISFTNFSKEDFTWKYDGIPYTFPAGASMFLEDFKAEHFAQHLVDRELNRLNIPTNNQVERERLGKLCFPTLKTVTPVEALQINEQAKQSSDKVEKEFPDLAEEKTASKKKVISSKD